MYQFIDIPIENAHCITLHNPDDSNQLIINLSEGARITFFRHQDNIIIGNLLDIPYSESYAAAILFPFTNRIKDGKYAFNSINYELDCNEIINNNAIHGLVYNKPFSISNIEESETYISITLNYKAFEGVSGFPFKYSIDVTYVLNDAGLKLRVSAKNEGDQTFPFTLGWHPYFISYNMPDSQLVINGIKNFSPDKRGIVNDAGQTEISKIIQLGNIQLDDVFEVESNMAEFTTTDYCLKLQTDSADNYLQVYTPDDPQAIAIEPMVGISDSFNHKIGLQELDPGECFEKEWHLNITDFKQNRINKS